MSASSTPFRPALIASLLTAAAGGALAAAAAAAAPAEVRPALGWFAACGVLLLSAAAFAVTWYGRTSRTLSRRAETLAAEIASKEAYFSRRTSDLEQTTAALRDRYAAEAAASEAARAAQAEELVRSHASAIERLTGERNAEVEGLESRLRRAESGRSAAMAAAANAAGRMQALATSMLADLREMEHRHADENVLTDLLHLDHRTAQAGRLADSVAVLTGARSGRRWARPIVMESILRGAMGRIGGYQRVRLHSSSDAAVAGHAAEGVMHALAELMDNAANFSPPTAEVHVYVEEVPAGIIVAVEDSGLVMSDVQLRRAEAAVGAETQDLAGLSGTRLGLAVVGRLARKHGLTVSFRPSARGGTGALLMLPQELITRMPLEPSPAVADALPPVSGRAVSASAALPSQATERDRVPTPPAGPEAHAVAPAADAEPETVHDTASESTGDHPRFGESGLPQRRRGRALAQAHPEGPEAAAEKARSGGSRGAAAAGAATRFGTFRRAVRGTAADPGTSAGRLPSDEDPSRTAAGAEPVDASRSEEASSSAAGSRPDPAGPAADAATPSASSDQAVRTSAPQTPPSSNSSLPEGNPQ
ncbi:sensor histidine kinase [Streptomyces sp. NPDC085614]|uniref:sensor histidine kinase n=1 Tax=Streptomyces sp. NPDC085614 TaxID=3365733 RepID=UPI0037CD869C